MLVHGLRLTSHSLNEGVMLCPIPAHMSRTEGHSNFRCDENILRHAVTRVTVLLLFLSRKVTCTRAGRNFELTPIRRQL